MHCAKCGAENLEGRKFCTQCGSPLAAKCPRCGAVTQPGEKFCGECGAALGTSPAATGKSDEPQIRIAGTPAPENLEGERKIVTFLFADIKGSMDLIEDLDPEEARAIVDPALKMMTEAVHHYGGYVAQPTGDGIFAMFGAPIAHEDHPQRALFAALRLQEEMRRYSAKLRMAGNLPVEARVGVNTGEVVVRSITTGQGTVEYAPIGHSTGLAARMQALAPTGSIAATEPIRKLCDGYFLFKSLGPTKVKGVREPVNVYEVTGLGPLRTRLQRVAARGYTKFVGRGQEMEALRHAAERAKAGHGQIVAVRADPGVGKSRLFYEFKSSSQSDWMVLDALSLSHERATAYAPLVNLLRVYFRIMPEDDPRTRREKVAGRITMLDRSLEQETLPPLFALLGIVEGEDPFAQIRESLNQPLDAEIRRQRTRDVVKRILLRESLNQPLILIFEDLHWIDEETQAFLNLFVEEMANAPVLLLVNYRPEYSHQWGSKSCYTQLRLDPLGKESAEEMLSTLLDGPELAPLRRLIIEKTEGNPLFMEEIYQSLVEDGSLECNGSVKLVRPVEQLRMPATVQDILAARIDHLPPEEKELLQTAAVIGKECSYELLKAVSEFQEKKLTGSLNQLIDAELFDQHQTSSGNNYRFRHALIRDAAYVSLLKRKRHEYHRKAAEVLQERFPETVEAEPELLANHFSDAGLIAEAVPYWIKAGQTAIKRSADQEAIRHLTRGLELLKLLPESPEHFRDELLLQTCLGSALIPTKGFSSPEVELVYGRGRQLCQHAGEAPELFPVLSGLWMFYTSRGKHTVARDLAEHCLRIARTVEESGLLVHAYQVSGVGFITTGHFVQAKEHLEQALERYDARELRSMASTYGQDPAAFVLTLVSWPLWFLGYPDQALRRCREAEALAQQLNHPFTSLTVAAFGTWLYQFTRNYQAVEALASRVISISTDHDFRFYRPYGLIMRGWTLVERGQVSDGIAEMRAGLEEYRIAGGGSIKPSFLSLLAEAYGKIGQFKQALNILAEAQDLADENEERWWQAELYRIKGELILRQRDGHTASRDIEIEAEECFHQALGVATAQEAKSLQLRAAMSLCNLWIPQSRHSEAHKLLGSALGGFEEGFHTPDLIDAKHLMDVIMGS